MMQTRWSDSEYPQPVLASLCGVVSRRKMRLVAAACCHRVSHLWCDETWRYGTEMAERHADRSITRRQLESVHINLVNAIRILTQSSGDYEAAARVQAARSVVWLTHPTKNRYAGSVVDCAAAAMAYAAEAAYTADLPGHEFRASTDFNQRWAETHAAERAAQMQLIRDVFHLSGRTLPVVLPHWLAYDNGLVLRLAREIYDFREFGDLPILADALEDASCSDQEILAHCRGPGPHTRGCWVLDLLLGQE